jgi:integrase
MKTAEAGGSHDFTSIAIEIGQRWGADSRLSGDLARDLTPQRTHTVDHINCPSCEAYDRFVKSDLLGMAGQRFVEAARVWSSAQWKSGKLRPRTLESLGEYLRALNKFFRDIRMSSINPGMLKAYQQARLSNAIGVAGQIHRPWRKMASHSRINHELNVLGQMLRACKEWEKIRPYYFPLKTNSWSPREILSEKEEEELFRKTAGYPEAELAYCVAAITNNTTASGIELRGLRLENVYLRPTGEISEIYIPAEACKNKHRPRKIALNEVARWAVSKVYQRAIKLGSTAPGHFLFPIRVKRNEYDPTRPATRWFLRCSWNHLREISGFHQLRPHDLRHHAITRMLEHGVDGELVNAISGHVSKRMREFYSHQRVRVRYEAAEAIEPDYDVRKLVADGRRRSRQERLKAKMKPQQNDTRPKPIETSNDLEELKRLKIRVEQLLAAAKPK